MRAVLRDGDTITPVTVDDKPVQVLFDHYPEFNSTFCTIRLLDETPELIIAEGVANCSEMDAYDKCKGRYLAWKRAVDSDIFTKEERANLWTWYTSTCKLPDRSFTASLRR